MRNRILALAFSVPILVAGSSLSLSAGPDENNNSSDKSAACSTAPDAVTNLPAPLDKWAQLMCTPSGYVITGREDWIWIEPTHYAVVIIPSQDLDGDTKVESANAYFTKVEISKVGGDEFEKAYKVFHAGLDPLDAKPVGYRLDVTTVGGSDIRVYMFDYFTYGWGMACSLDNCDTSSRFVMLNMNEEPKKLDPPI